LIVNVTNFAELTVAPNGFLPISLFIATPTQNPLPTIVEVLVQYLIRYMARFRSAATNAVLDEAYVTFIVR
jgi:hypothetical protein